MVAVPMHAQDGVQRMAAHELTSNQAYGIAQVGSTAVKNPPLSPAASMEVAHGKVLNRAGKPAGGVHIIVEAWPPQSVLARVKPGSNVPMRFAGSAVTNSAGRFTLRISAAADDPEAVNHLDDVRR